MSLPTLSNRYNHEEGSFAEYLISKACVQVKIPENVSFEQAATIGVSAVTCVSKSMQCLMQAT